MNEQTNNLRPMRFGRAMHMNLSRASDEDLARAYKVLDDYDNVGKASAYTQDLIDDRLSDIDDEGDRRAGVTPVMVERKPREFYHPGLDASAASEDDDAPDVDADDDVPEGWDVAETSVPEADGLTDAERAAGRAHEGELRDVFEQTGLVPGLTASL